MWPSKGNLPVLARCLFNRSGAGTSSLCVRFLLLRSRRMLRTMPGSPRMSDVHIFHSGVPGPGSAPCRCTVASTQDLNAGDMLKPNLDRLLMTSDSEDPFICGRFRSCSMIVRRRSSSVRPDCRNRSCITSSTLAPSARQSKKHASGHALMPCWRCDQAKVMLPF